MTAVRDSLAVMKKYRDTAPVDVFAIARDLGVDVIKVPMPRNISGIIRRKDHSSFEILVNSPHALVRQRFTVAHELGHCIYHRDLLGDGVGDTLAYRADDAELPPNRKIKLEHEWQANTFAANLLMPKALIETLQGQGIRSTAALADRLQVSEEALKIRLGMVVRDDVREPGGDVEISRPTEAHGI